MLEPAFSLFEIQKREQCREKTDNFLYQPSITVLSLNFITKIGIGLFRIARLWTEVN